MAHDVFHAIADPHRRAIFGLLARRKLTLNGVAEHFEISRPAVSKHVKILSECGLITIRRQGRERICEAKPERLNEVSVWVERYRALWKERLDALGHYLDEVQRDKPATLRGRKSVSRRSRE